MSTATPPWEGEPCFPADFRPRPPVIVSVTRRDGVKLSYADWKAKKGPKPEYRTRPTKPVRERRKRNAARDEAAAAYAAGWLMDGLEAAHAALDALAGSPDAEACRRILAGLGQRLRDAAARHAARQPAEPPPPEPEPSGPVIPFGKYRGEPYRRVAHHDPDYLRWVVENVRNPEWSLAASEALAACSGKKARASRR